MAQNNVRNRNHRGNGGHYGSITMQTIGGTRFSVGRKAPGWTTVHGSYNGKPVRSPRLHMDDGCANIGLSTTNPDDGMISISPADLAVAVKHLIDRGIISLDGVQVGGK